MLKKLREKIEQINWEDAAELSWWVKFVRRQVGLYFYILRELVRDRCLQQAAALTFTTLLSLVPLFAVAFSLYRSFAGIEGLADRAQNAIFEFLLARPLLERVVVEGEGAGQAEPGLSGMSADELLSEARRQALQGEQSRAVRLYTAALGAGAEPEQVRDALSTLPLPGPSTLASYWSAIGAEAKERYFAAAGIRPRARSPDEAAEEAAEASFRRSMDLFAKGEYADALDLLRAAEARGYDALEARRTAARIHEDAGNSEASGADLTRAAENYRAALVNDLDAALLASDRRAAERASMALRHHADVRQSLGQLLLKTGRQRANLYRSLREETATTAGAVLESAVENLEEAALLLDRSGEAHTTLARLLWESAGRREEARRHYEAALEKQGGTAALGLSTAAADYIRGFIDKVGRARIGILATVFLIITATSLLSTIEKTLNSIWKVTERRSFWVKFTSFWTLICLGPVLIGATIWVQEKLGRYVTMTFTDVPALGALISVAMTAGRYVVPFLTTWLLLVALYKFLPHTRVKFRSAAWGAFLGAILLQCARPLFTLYVANAVKYERIYGSLGIVPIFLLWVWLLWVIVLFGAEVSFTIQNVSLLRYHDKLRRLSDISIDRYLAARIMMYVAREFWETGQPISASKLARTLQITPEEAADAASRLVNLGLLTPVGDQRDEFHPARDLSKLKLSEVLSITDRFRSESRSFLPENKLYEEKLESAFRSAIESQDAALEGVTFRDLLQECERERSRWPKGAGGARR